MADENIDQLQAQIDSDPDIQAALRQIEEMKRQGVPLIGPSGGTSIMGWAQRNLAPILQSKGIQMPQDWSISLGQDGNVGELTQRGYWDRNVDWLAPAIVGAAGAAGGAGAAGAFGGGGGAGAGAGAGAGTAAAGTGAEIGLGGALGALPATTTTTLPALGAGAGGSVAGGSILSQLASNPETYATIAGQLGRFGEGQAGERGAENAYEQYANAIRNSQFNTAQTAASRAKEAEERGALDRAQLGIAAPSARTRQSILGSLLQNMQPASFGNTGRVKVPTVRGGLTPADLNPAARQTGSELQKQAIDALLSGSDIPEPTDFSSALMEPPQMTGFQGPGTGESILSGIGAGGNMLSGILASLNKKSTPQPGAPAVGG